MAISTAHLPSGVNGDGTLFSMTSSSAVSFIYSFTGGLMGQSPWPGWCKSSDGNFYGTAYEGGAYSYGSVFKSKPNGLFTVLYEFTGDADGAYPYAGLVQGRDGNFYGTTLEVAPAVMARHSAWPRTAP